ncbi:hypothetical protein C3B59_11675 [Cryobacterium zongtaii]|uniref:Uncharacterized protein n=1 Tax=Cryobacterium zongtaii TaxID=1259217 RepID=A0A2S3Z9J8_9MICO|nr:hypothetical protein C3B59_11675 [Cryobacterium zongtaii]
MVDVLLIGWALSARSADPVSEPPQPIPTFTPSEPEATSTSGAAATIAIPSARLLSALDVNTAWRATTGECPTASATPELSTDAGATWQSTDATSDVQVTALQKLNVVSDTLVELVGLSAADCAPQFVKSFVAGNDYSDYAAQLEDQWYVNPAERSVVHTPAGDAAAPCAAVVALAPRTDAPGSGAILCSDTQVFVTEDSGDTWTGPTKVPGAVNLAVTQVGYLIAAVGLPECAGVQLAALSVEAMAATPTGCLPVGASAETMQGKVAVSEAAGAIWVWVGESVTRSIDKGQSWQ